MKTLLVARSRIQNAGRWDIDFHLPPEEIRRFPANIVAPVRKAADVVKTKRDPTKKPEETFLYVDIASVDVATGTIVNPQELTGEEAPSRARKVIHAYDIIISTCRPTRGAIAVVPESLHGQICSTGFSVIRCKDDVNPFYLHFALRMASTLEQFRKWSTGSSYPAILDEDVEKTLIPLPTPDVQDAVSRSIRSALARREAIISAANKEWEGTTNAAIQHVIGLCAMPDVDADDLPITTIGEVATRKQQLSPPEGEEVNGDYAIERTLFDDEDDQE